MVGLLAEHGFCEDIGPLADRWYLSQGDPAAYARTLVRCFEPSEAAARLQKLRPAWGPLGDVRSWEALVRSGHQPFQLLYRDLDIVLDMANRVDAQVLLLTYPSPTEDHLAISEALAEFVQTRSVHFLDLRALWAQRITAERWAELLGPNGHCNEEGYALMAQDILAFIKERAIPE
jgi:hypothetical protein